MVIAVQALRTQKEAAHINVDGLLHLRHSRPFCHVRRGKGEPDKSERRGQLGH